MVRVCEYLSQTRVVKVSVCTCESWGGQTSRRGLLTGIHVLYRMRRRRETDTTQTRDRHNTDTDTNTNTHTHTDARMHSAMLTQCSVYLLIILVERLDIEVLDWHAVWETSMSQCQDFKRDLLTWGPCTMIPWMLVASHSTLGCGPRVNPSSC